MHVYVFVWGGRGGACVCVLANCCPVHLKWEQKVLGCTPVFRKTSRLSRTSSDAVIEAAAGSGSAPFRAVTDNTGNLDFITQAL